LKLHHLFLFTILLPGMSCSNKQLAIFFDGVPPEQTEIPTPADSVVKSQQVLAEKEQTQVETQKVLSVHPAYQKKKCDKCHLTQHGNRLIDREPALCNQCHKDYTKATPFVHGPVAAGFCNSCHVPHKSVNKSLLILPIREICQHCHAAGDVNKNKAHEKTSDVPCLECHYAHGGQTILMLKNSETIK